MKYHLCLTPERLLKTQMIMRALRPSLPGSVIVTGEPPEGSPFVVWGHLWTGEKIVPPAIERGTPFYFIDNGYMHPANGGAQGYYAVTYRSFAPMLLDDPDWARLRVDMKDWRDPSQNPNGRVLVCAPGRGFGKMFGWDMNSWLADIVVKLKTMTDRPIVVRDKWATTPFEQELQNTAIVVTHSSKAAIRAIHAGIPCIVEHTSACAPVAGSDLSQLEHPPMPDRTRWWASLMCQQFTLDEMRKGTATHWLEEAERQGEREKETSVPNMSRLLGDSPTPSKQRRRAWKQKKS